MSYTTVSSVYDNLTEKEKEELDFYLWVSEMERDFKDSYRNYKTNSNNKWKCYPTNLTTNKNVVQ